MSAVKFNDDKETAIEFHQVAKSIHKKHYPEIQDKYLQHMRTTEGKEFIKNYISHKNNPLSFNESKVLNKNLKAIEEARPKWKNNYENKAAADRFVSQSVSDDVKAMMRDEPHPQLIQENYQWRDVAGDISKDLSISEVKRQSLSQSLSNMMSNLSKEHDFKEHEIKSLLVEPTKNVLQPTNAQTKQSEISR